jgi:hypothetical protein
MSHALSRLVSVDLLNEILRHIRVFAERGALMFFAAPDAPH